MWFKGVQGRFIPAVWFNYLTNTSYRHLGGKPIMLTEVAVSEMVKFYLTGRMILKGKMGDIVTRLIKSLHRFQEDIELVWRSS